MQDKEESARRALQGYRERRRKRRGDDTYFGSSEIFREAVEEGLSVDELDRRRSAILEEAERDGVPSELVALLYDIAAEEGLDPAIGFELVRTGLGVAPPPGGVSTAPEAPSADKYLPTWMFPASAPDDVLRERMLRVSFRRLKRFLEAEGDAEQALLGFAREPDVGHFGY